MAEIDQMHCSEEKEFKSRQCILTISLSSPLVEQCAPSFDFNKFESPFTQGCFVPSLTENDQVILEKKIFGWNWPSGFGEKITILLHVYWEQTWIDVLGSGEEVYWHTDRRRTSGYLSAPCTSFFDAMFKNRGPLNFHIWENVFFHMVAYLCPLHAR